MATRGEAEQSLETLGYVSAVSSAAHMACSSLDRGAMLRLTGDIMVETVKSRNVSSALYIKDEEQYRLHSFIAPFEPPEFAPPELTRTLQLRNITEAEEAPTFATGDYCRGSSLLIPLCARARLTGFVVLFAPEKFAIDDLKAEMLVTLGAICAMSIEMMRLYEEMNARMEEMRLMQQRLLENERLATMQRLVAGITHEIKNPLTAAYSIAQMLQEDDSAGKEMVPRLLKTLKRTKEQVISLLDYAKAKKRQFVSVNLSKLLEQTLKLLPYELRKKDIKLVCRYDREVKAKADPVQVSQVFLNLIMNSLDAVERGGTIHLRVKRAHDGRAEAIITDNGSGISEENKNRLFKPFFTTKKGGSGMGLFMCQSIVKSTGGEIRVRSRLGKGTLFSILLPPAH